MGEVGDALKLLRFPGLLPLVPDVVCVGEVDTLSWVVVRGETRPFCVRLLVSDVMRYGEDENR